MDEKTNREPKPGEQEAKTHSAFPRRDAASADSSEQGEKPIPSQPRSFSPVRPQRNPAPRKDLTTPGSPSPASPATGKSAAESDSKSEKLKPGDKSPSSIVNPAGTNAPVDKAQSTAGTDADKSGESNVKAADAKNGKVSAAEVSTAGTIGSDSGAPQSSGAGGDTIRLRVSPRPHPKTLNTAPGRGLRRRLPDIRQGKAQTSSGHYGPFSLMFGFLWLLFKMVFFTVLVLGLGAVIGFMVMTEYIKTPEVVVPNVSGMKIEEAFDVLSDKHLGVIKRDTQSSGLVAPGEIVSQQPPAGSMAKVDTDVGVVISSGRSQYVVPNVVNETRENAINKIQGARLEVGNLLTLEDASVPQGNVISQTPIEGTGFDEPIKVDLMISAGPPGKSLTMPDLAGRTVFEAKAALEAVGISDIVTKPDDAEPDAKVSGHTPLVGKTVFQTDRVTLTAEE